MNSAWKFNLIAIGWAVLIAAVYILTASITWLPCQGSMAVCLQQDSIWDVLARNINTVRFKFFLAVLFAFLVLGLLRSLKRTSRSSLSFLSVLLIELLFFGASLGFISFLGSSSDDITITTSFLQSLKLISGLIIIALLTLIPAYGMGSWIIEKLKVDISDTTIRILFAVGLGLMCTEALLFSLLASKLPGVISMLSVILLGILVGRSYIRSLLTKCGRFEIAIPNTLFSISSISIFLLHVIGVYLLIGSLTEVPVSWDAFYRYLNTVHIIAESGRLVYGIFPYPVELIISTGPLLTGKMVYAFGMLWVIALLVCIATYKFFRLLADSSTSLLATLMIFSMPVMNLIVGLHNKVDLGSIFFVLLACIAFILMLGRKKPCNSMLYMGILFASMAATAKLTSGFFLVSYAIVALVVFVRIASIAIASKKFISLIAMYCFIGIMPFLPWGVLYAAQITHHIPSWQFSDSNAVYADQCFLEETNYYLEEKGVDESSQYVPTGQKEEFVKYTGSGPRDFMWYAVLPWRLVVSMSDGQTNYIRSLGPCILFLLPFVVLCASRPEKHNRLVLWSLVAIASGSLLMWMRFGNAVSWYTLPAVLIFASVVLWVLEHRALRHIRYAMIGLLALQVFLMVTIPLSQTKLNFIAGSTLDEDISLKTYLNGRLATEYINLDQPSVDDAKLVYNMRGTIIYWIAENDLRVYNDHYVDTYECLLQSFSEDTEMLYAYLRQKGFRYITINDSLKDFDVTTEKTLATKASRAEDSIRDAFKRGLIKEIRNTVDGKSMFYGIYYIP